MTPENFFNSKSELEEIYLPETEANQVRLFIKRDDLLHSGISGNKWRKLKYNLLNFKETEKRGIITFGGAYSNHLHAVAVAGKIFNIPTAGIVRGEEPKEWSHTLKDCFEVGMKLFFVSRSAYQVKENSEEIKKILIDFEDFLLLPEGGENEEARLGCREIVEELPFEPEYLCVPCGTGTTLAGILMADLKSTVAVGFPVLKGAEKSILENINLANIAGNNFLLISDYHFGGYAKYTSELLSFITKFKQRTGIQLEQVYSGKMMFGILDLISKGYFKKGSRIVAIHTGGLQGKLIGL